MSKRFRKTGWWIALGLVSLLSGPLRAAGFDCAKASSRIEKEICADKTVSALDERMSAAYRALAHRLPREGQWLLRADQRHWLQARDLAKTPAKLRELYRQRLSELKAKRQALAGGDAWPFGELAVVHPVMALNPDTGAWEDAGLSADTYALRRLGAEAISFRIQVVGSNGDQCEVQGTATLRGKGEYVWTGSTADDPMPAAKPAPSQDLCTIRITLAKDAVRIRTAGGEACHQGCGAQASLSDVVLLPVEKTKS